jgi:hypothetical protein
MVSEGTALTHQVCAGLRLPAWTYAAEELPQPSSLLTWQRSKAPQVAILDGPFKGRFYSFNKLLSTPSFGGG